MLKELDQILQTALAEIEPIRDEQALQDFRVRFLGKKGALSDVKAGLRDVPKEDKPLVGKKLNEVQNAITQAIEARMAQLLAEADAKVAEGIDVTLPARPYPAGAQHPLSQTLDRAVLAMRRMGFAIAEGPEVETEWYCFDALNTPEDHPARNESDTYYFDNGKLLRTHTSTVQIRTMEKADKLPVRIIAPGTAFRRDEIDETHSLSFTQLEGLYVAENVSLADLKGTLEYFFQFLFGDDTELRLRPHFFPFTEPSYECDVKLQSKGREDKWIEICGCGMVDPAVFEAVGVDPEEWSGFAFGLGLERLAMRWFGVPDIRYFTENDARFLRQLD